MSDVRVEPAKAPEVVLTLEIQATLWQTWAERGPQGPVEDDGDAQLPPKMSGS